MSNEPAHPLPPPARLSSIPHRDLTSAIIGGFYDVHSELGSGFLESVYTNALAVVLTALNLRAERQVRFEVHFRGVSVGRYVADLIVESKVVVETKAARSLDPVHRAQLLNYLRASGLEVGLLLNFGPTAQFKRVILGRHRDFPRAVTKI